MITFTGIQVTPEFGAPSIRDIAVQSMRIIRFAGAGRICWTVGLHSLLVADLLPVHLEHHGLLHDAAEVIVSDVPVPMKTAAARDVEGIVLTRIYHLLGLPLPTVEEAKLVHAADISAALAEGVMGCGPRGFSQTQRGFKRAFVAEEKLEKYLAEYQVADSLNPDGRWSIQFEKRLRRAIRRVHTEAA